ncbi:MAG TPA: oligopeptide/dipeptide ABC transporter ATP-binding protein [Polyangiaceae bacterium]|nr:oligopeptide/dipeptide ABC transporter ATP-binding protein [Polyangiaceae bacterium]
MTALLDVRDLRVHFPVRRGILQRTVASVRAVDGVSFEVKDGETLGLVGESGCGKSTTARAIMRLERATSGRVTLEGKDILRLGHGALREARRHMQMVFQDPQASLNPRMTVFDTVAEPLRVHGIAKGKTDLEDRVRALMEQVGLAPAMMRRYPHEFSGGQRQRVGIARAIALRPKLVLLDEPVSALDVSIQAQILNLLSDLQRELGLAYVFVAHDLAVVRYISTEIAVMYLGRIVERAPAEELFRRPLHPYTETLLSAIPIPDPVVEKQRKRLAVVGEVPSPLAPPPGCHFHPRCPIAKDRCKIEPPLLRELAPRHTVACHEAVIP